MKNRSGLQRNEQSHTKGKQKCKRTLNSKSQSHCINSLRYKSLFWKTTYKREIFFRILIPTNLSASKKPTITHTPRTTSEKKPQRIRYIVQYPDSSLQNDEQHMEHHPDQTQLVDVREAPNRTQTTRTKTTRTRNILSSQGAHPILRGNVRNNNNPSSLSRHGPLWSHDAITWQTLSDRGALGSSRGKVRWRGVSGHGLFQIWRDDNRWDGVPGHGSCSVVPSHGPHGGAYHVLDKDFVGNGNRRWSGLD